MIKDISVKLLLSVLLFVFSLSMTFSVFAWCRADVANTKWQVMEETLENVGGTLIKVDKSLIKVGDRLSEVEISVAKLQAVVERNGK